MEVVTSAWHVFGASLVFFIGAASAIVLHRHFAVPWKRSLFLYGWHTCFSMIYLAYSLNAIADATIYYDQSLVHRGGFSGGTEFVYFFASIFTQGLGLSYLGIFLVFNVIGFIGLLAFYGAARSVVVDKSVAMQRLAWLVVLLPSASFWSGALGKDAIAFMAACLYLWSALALRRRAGLILFAIVAMLAVRPHIAGLMVGALAGGLLMTPGLRRATRLALGAASLAGAIIIIPMAIEYAGLEDAQGSSDVIDYIEQRQSYNQAGGGGIDISAMSLPMQLTTYLYRPLPFEAHSVTSLAAAVENLILVFLSIAAVGALFRFKRRHLISSQLVMWFYVIATWLILSATTANLGIAVRQKWMFLPVLLCLLLSMLGRDTRQAGSPLRIRSPGWAS